VSTEHLVPQDLRERYYVKEWRNATGILASACPNEWEDIKAVLRKFQLLRSEIEAAGKNRSAISRQIDGGFYDRGWAEVNFRPSITLTGMGRPKKRSKKAQALPLVEFTYESPTHSVDCFRGRVALEVEWNAKDPFFDRDLNNFRLLFDLRAIDVGVIITRASELQQIFNDLGKGKSYGNSTTHHGKLWPRLDGGGGGGCPVLTFAIKPDLYVDDGPPTSAEIAKIKAELRKENEDPN